MSTYNDKHAIVLDVGMRYIKSGVSEERAPRCILRWEIAELLAARADDAACRAYLATQLHRICFDLMHVNPRHRRFLVCEDVLGPRRLREALVEVLFADLKASSVTLVPSAIAALYATDQHTALVVDCGYNETRLLPVYKGIPLLYCFLSAPVGAASCCAQLEQTVDEGNEHTRARMEDALERACFIQPLQNRIMEVADATFNLQGARSLVIPATTRSDVCENLFLGTEASGASIISCFEELLVKLPLDVRAAMVENVLVVGGVSMVPGFCGRLQEELVASLDASKQRLSERVTMLCPLFPRNVLSWVGASIFAATTSAADSTVSANEYASAGSRCLPDWASIAETEI